jgi:heme oxygenase (biliverdin-IX-beta and delta-forming)
MRERLRVETRALHRRTERACPFGRGLARDGYVAHLARRLGFQAAIEAELTGRFDWGALELACPGDGVALLVADLRFFGYSTAELERLPRCAELPPLDSAAAALGCAYVLDGARVGGHSVAPTVARELGLERAGVEFLTGGLSEAQVRERFAATLSTIDRHAGRLDARGRDAIVGSARETFAALARWLEHA